MKIEAAATVAATTQPMVPQITPRLAVPLGWEGSLQNLGPGNPRPDGSSVKPGSEDPVRARRAAREFEAQLLESWLESLQQTYAIGGGEDKLTGSENYRYLSSQTMANSLAQHGGLGIARMLLHSMKIEDSQNSLAGTKAPVGSADSNH